MKIAYLNSCYPAMSHTFIQREIEALRACGVEVHTFSCRKPDATGLLGATHQREAKQTTYLLNRAAAADQLTANPLRYAKQLSCSVRGMAHLVQAARLAHQMRRRGLKHVHVHMANNGAAVARLATRLDPTLSYSLTIHGHGDLFDMAGNRLARKLAGARFVRCISDFCRSQVMIVIEPAAWEKLHVVHCGLELGTFPSVPSYRHGALHILTVGRLAPEKGHLQLLEACRRLTTDWRLMIVGDGPMRASLAAAADARVTFAGAVSSEDIGAHYNGADLFVLSSFAEGVPVVLMEAMATGLPVIATRVGGVAELIEDGVTGRLVAPGNVDQLVGAIEEAAAGQAPWIAARDLRRQRIVEDFNIDRIGQQMAGLFEHYTQARQSAHHDTTLLHYQPLPQ